MGTFKVLLENQDVLILHGALGTELEALGYDISGKLWSAKYLLEEPSIIQEIHETYGDKFWLTGKACHILQIHPVFLALLRKMKQGVVQQLCKLIRLFWLFHWFVQFCAYKVFAFSVLNYSYTVCLGVYLSITA